MCCVKMQGLYLYTLIIGHKYVNMLKMLGLYLYTLIIGHKSVNMLSILNKLTLKKELQNFVTNNVFLDKHFWTQQQQYKKSNITTLAGMLSMVISCFIFVVYNIYNIM